MQVENRFIDYFDKDTEIYKGMYEIDSKLGGTATLDIIISQPEDTFESIEIEDEFFEDDLFEDEGSSASGYWWNIYSLRKLEDIHDYLDSIPEIGKVLSVASGIKLARQINNGEDLNDLIRFLSVKLTNSSRILEIVGLHAVAAKTWAPTGS